MREEQAELTVSDSKEESIRKAVEILQSGNNGLALVSRPDVSAVKILVSFILWLVALVLVCVIIAAAGFHFAIPLWTIWAAIGLVCALVFIFKAKSLVLNAVLLYQKLAPEQLRRSCLFTPTCSEYMRLSVEKYGVVKGCSKGIRRLCRCHHPNGGVDYP